MVRSLLDDSRMPEINAPAVVAELNALHDTYERALAANDVPALTDFFWNSPHTVRFGVNEHLYGADAVASYRQTTAPAFTERTLLRRSILVIGNDTASIMCELSQKILGQLRHSRQSQVWVRFPGLGWKIVSAHVSNALTAPSGVANWDSYVDQTAAALGLRIDPAHRAGVIQSVQRTATIAAPLLGFSIPGEVEIAPIFTP
jgi:hypothetical protein